MTVADSNSNLAFSDVDPYPRSIVTRIYSWNWDNNLPATNAPTFVSNKYFAQQMDPSLDVRANYNSGCVP